MKKDPPSDQIQAIEYLIKAMQDAMAAIEAQMEFSRVLQERLNEATFTINMLTIGFFIVLVWLAYWSF
jgi:hypothetical protein